MHGSIAPVKSKTSFRSIRNPVTPIAAGARAGRGGSPSGRRLRLVIAGHFHAKFRSGSKHHLTALDIRLRILIAKRVNRGTLTTSPAVERLDPKLTRGVQRFIAARNEQARPAGAARAIACRPCGVRRGDGAARGPASPSRATGAANRKRPGDLARHRRPEAASLFGEAFEKLTQRKEVDQAADHDGRQPRQHNVRIR